MYQCKQPNISNTITNQNNKINNDKSENNYNKTKKKTNNKTSHCYNRNKQTKILQIYSSNSDWGTKEIELLATMNDNQADVTVVSEANLTNPHKNVITSSTYKDYKIENKPIRNNDRSRISVVINKTIQYTRLHNLESVKIQRLY